MQRRRGARVVAEGDGQCSAKPSSSDRSPEAPHAGFRPAREEISRGLGASIDAIDGKVAGPLGLDGKPARTVAMIAIERLADEKAWV